MAIDAGPSAVHQRQAHLPSSVSMLCLSLMALNLSGSFTSSRPAGETPGVTCDDDAGDGADVGGGGGIGARDVACGGVDGPDGAGAVGDDGFGGAGVSAGCGTLVGCCPGAGAAAGAGPAGAGAVDAASIMTSAIRLALPPGAAHRSSTWSHGASHGSVMGHMGWSWVTWGGHGVS